MTAVDILKKQKRTGIHDFYYEDEYIIIAMEEYAKLKCQELLEIVAEKAKTKYSETFGAVIVDKYSILDAVNLDEFIN